MKARMLKLMKLIRVLNHLKMKKEHTSTNHSLHMGNTGGKFRFNSSFEMPPAGTRKISVMANWTKLDLPPVFLPEKIPILKPIGETEFKTLNGAQESFNSKMSNLRCFFTAHDTDIGILVVHELLLGWLKLSGKLNPASYMLEVSKGDEGGEADLSFVLNHGSYNMRGATLEPIVVSTSGKILTPLESSIRKIESVPRRLPRFEAPMDVFLKIFAQNGEAQPKDGILVLWKLQYSLVGGGKVTPVLYSVRERVCCVR